MHDAGRFWIALSSLSIFLAVTLFSARSLLDRRLPPFANHEDFATERCQAPKKNVWADLSDDEVLDLLDFLYNGQYELNLTRNDYATAYDNTVRLVEVLPPNKTDAIPYLHETSATPPRWARVTVSRGVTDEAGIYEYMVGPLPPSSDTQILPLTFCFNSGKNYVRNPIPDHDSIIAWFVQLGDEISDLIDDLFGNVTNPGNLPNAPPLMANSRPAQFSNGSVIAWASVLSPGLRFDSWSLMPQGLYFKFNITGRDPSHWAITEWLYNGVFYNSTKAFRSAWKTPGFEKLPQNMDGDWSTSEPSKEGFPGRDELPPIMIHPTGSRVKVDERERFVSWMGFEFFLTTMKATAVSLWDIKFKGERVMYELSLQEAMAHYAGNDPMSAGMVWMDTLFGMGHNMYELVPGYDCPAYATYLSTSFHEGEQTVVRNNSICIFEYTADYPLQRHTTPTHLTISRNTYLVVRWVSTVGNYDYTIEYLFYLDGTIEVKVRASGYIFGAFNVLPSTAAEESGLLKRETPEYSYGYQIHDNLASSMHDHTLNFKADLDVAGTENTLYRVDIQPYTQNRAWDEVPRRTMHLVHTPYEKETGLNWPYNANAMYIVLNNESRNAWGEKKGYRIVPGTGVGNPPHLTMEDYSTALDRAAQWSTKDLWVTKAKDTERRSTSEYNGMEPSEPQIEFSKMVDSEDIVQEDLTLWFNLGTHHIPHSGDIPNTLMHTSATSVMFVPHNFLNRDASRNSVQGVKLEMREDGKGSKVMHYGAVYDHEVTCMPDDLEPDLSRYKRPEDSLIGLTQQGVLAEF